MVISLVLVAQPLMYHNRNHIKDIAVGREKAKMKPRKPAAFSSTTTVSAQDTHKQRKPDSLDESRVKDKDRRHRLSAKKITLDFLATTST